MIQNTPVEMEKIDWECLSLLSKKEKIPIPKLIGKFITSKLEEYEESRLSAIIKQRESEPFLTHEEFWARVDTE